MSYIPKFKVITWSAYNIPKFSFYTKSNDDCSTMQNRGVMVEAESMYFSSSKNKNLLLASRAYIGVIEEILVIHYATVKVLLFKCKWINSNTGVETYELGFTQVDLWKETYMNESFNMSFQAKQIVYVTDASNTRWSIVL